MSQYKADTRICFHVSTGMVGSAQKDTQTIEDWTGLSQAQLDPLSDEDIEKALNEAHQDFLCNTLDSGWWPVTDD